LRALRGISNEKRRSVRFPCPTRLCDAGTLADIPVLIWGSERIGDFASTEQLVDPGKLPQSVLPPTLAQALGPLLLQIADMTVKIKQYDCDIKRLPETAYPETQALIKVYGVGHLTALTFYERKNGDQPLTQATFS
jgi:hypothetical protein